jgi:hypothetical protein
MQVFQRYRAAGHPANVKKPVIDGKSLAHRLVSGGPKKSKAGDQAGSLKAVNPPSRIRALPVAKLAAGEAR